MLGSKKVAGGGLVVKGSCNLLLGFNSLGVGENKLKVLNDCSSKATQGWGGFLVMAGMVLPVFVMSVQNSGHQYSFIMLSLHCNDMLLICTWQ